MIYIGCFLRCMIGADTARVTLISLWLVARVVLGECLYMPILICSRHPSQMFTGQLWATFSIRSAAKQHFWDLEHRARTGPTSSLSSCPHLFSLLSMAFVRKCMFNINLQQENGYERGEDERECSSMFSSFVCTLSLRKSPSYDNVLKILNIYT